MKKYTFLKMMTRIIQFKIALLLFVTLGLIGTAKIQRATAANLKSMAIVEGNLIHAGDLFDGIDRQENKVIGAAPMPGQDMVLNARTLLRIAMALDVSWRPQSGSESVIIRRAATIIGQDMIENALQETLEDSGVSGEYRLIFDNETPTIILPQQMAQSLQIGAFDYDPTGGFFKAELIAPSKDNPVQRTLVSGKVERIIELPILKRSLQSGQLISAADIDWISIAAHKIQHDFILSTDQLLGMTPRRIAMAGEPLRQTEIIEPLLVKRGENVMINYSSGPIMLSAEGRALQNGSRGDTIKVVNHSSNQTINATITNPNSVSVN